MSLYPKNTTPTLDMELFRNPTAEYRGTPFWSWNCKLDRAELMRQIAWAPFQVELGALANGQHALDLTAYGSRVNTFGCVHNANAREYWFGPAAWRTTGDRWSYEYRLKPAGLLAALHLLAEQD